MTVIGDRIEQEIRIEAPPEVVFSYFTDPERHTAWLGQRATLDATPGGIYRVVMNGQATVTGAYIVVNPPHRVVFTWGFEGDETVPEGSSTVDVTFTPDGNATMLRLVHTGLPHPALAPHSEGWNRHLRDLATVTGGG